MNDRVIDPEFGIILMDDEELILSIKPTPGFITYGIVVACFTVVGILFLPIIYPLLRLAYGKYRYWLTNRRVILGYGLIGFRVRSIPLERISDVALSRTFPEIVAGITSVIVRDMTGETQTGKSLFAIDDAAETQKRILEEVRRVNAERQGI